MPIAGDRVGEQRMRHGPFQYGARGDRKSSLRLPKSFHRADLTTSIQPTPPQKPRNYRRFSRALFRTRTGDPFLTMEVLYQLS